MARSSTCSRRGIELPPRLWCDEKVDERTAHAKYGVTSVDTWWTDTDKEFEERPAEARSRIVARGFKSGDRPDLSAGTLPLEALKAIPNHWQTFGIMHIDVSREYVHAKASAGASASRRRKKY